MNSVLSPVQGLIFLAAYGLAIIAFTSFLGILIWACSRHNRARFEEASRLPLEDEAPRSCCTGKGDAS